MIWMSYLILLLLPRHLVWRIGALDEREWREGRGCHDLWVFVFVVLSWIDGLSGRVVAAAAACIGLFV
jgi:hypothetical protein